MVKSASIFLFVMVLSQTLFSQNKQSLPQYEGISKFIEQTIPVIKHIEDSLNAEVVFIQYDLFKGQKKAYRTLVGNNSYSIFVMCAETKLFDVSFYRQKGRRWVLENTQKSVSGFVMETYKPQQTENVKIELFDRKQDLNTNSDYFCIIIFQ